VREIKVPDSVMAGIAAVALTTNDADGEQPHGRKAKQAGIYHPKSLLRRGWRPIANEEHTAKK